MPSKLVMGYDSRCPIFRWFLHPENCAPTHLVWCWTPEPKRYTLNREFLEHLIHVSISCSFHLGCRCGLGVIWKGGPANAWNGSQWHRLMIKSGDGVYTFQWRGLVSHLFAGGLQKSRLKSGPLCSFIHSWKSADLEKQWGDMRPLH